MVTYIRFQCRPSRRSFRHQDASTRPKVRSRSCGIGLPITGAAQPASGGLLRLQILGPLRLWRDGVELDAGPRQQAYLLALLLAREGRLVSMGELVDLIWDDDAPASAVNVIQKSVSYTHL